MNAPVPLRHIAAADLPALVAGNELLSSGRGAAGLDGLTVCVGALLDQHGPVPLVPLDGLPSGNRCVAVGAVGGFAPLIELPFSGDEFAAAVRALEDRTGEAVDAVVALNSAGPNALVPVAAAAALGVPLVDCDGMGRILPLIHQTTYALAGLPVAPLAAMSAAGDSVVLDCSTARADLLLRGAVDASGGLMTCAMYPTTVERLRHAAIRGSTSRILRMGELLLTQNRHAAVLAGLARTVGARLLASGRVVALDLPEPAAGARHYPSMPTSIVVSDPASDGPVVRLEAQNEILLALVDGAVVAAVPDVVCLLDRQKLRPVGLEGVAVGDHVDVLVVPAAPRWHTPEGLALAGPRAFGFPVRHPNEEGSR
ncbi:MULTISPECIES: DUF917 domain-containing protein [unclassified Streptomyces]|uniref:DUF917 domain-containing protein n=1 Tax=unclassified Streptomyces TaxID=2593676 RepID=UPI0022B627F6|nr:MULTISPECIES: DUF917 domain-containing protein [unclassified Streptomyces]MCZ7415734.1 DUF917 domain-containing protein [Streptomyces sp. WMMC897]MCZ7434455.1 DUF917 domain-containing protein [Streptomyces sp. WMMC1477]